MTGNPELIAAIRREIEASGPITFARFMELALYHPEHGYYMSGQARIGKEGDFITSPTVGPVFGRFLGMQFAEMWELMGKPKPFVLLELGAHHGWLAEDVMQWARERRPDFADAVDYWVCERGGGSGFRVQGSGKWFADWHGIADGAVTGCIFSNELVDAFPVHRIRRENGEWKELYVGLKSNEWELLTGDLSFALHPSSLILHPFPNGYTTEVNFAAFDWLAHMSRILKRGFVLTIDYGFPELEYYAPHRTDGTLLCYYRHTTNNEPLERIGEQDITAHVNFTCLISYGDLIGLEKREFSDQTHFIMRIGKEEIEQIVAARPGQPDKLRRQLQLLLHPGGMGRTFKVLVQQKVEAGVTATSLRP